MKIYLRSFAVFIFFVLPVSSIASIINPEPAGPEFIDSSLVPESMVTITQKIVDGYNNKDEALLYSIYDFNRLATLASKDLYDNAKNEQDFAKGLASTKERVINMHLDYLTRADGYVVFLGYIKRNGIIFPQIRMDLGDYGVDYLEFYIETNSAGETFVVDWYQLSTDLPFSKTVGLLAKLMTDPNPGLLKKIFGIVSIDKSVVSSIRELGKARQTGDFGKANQIFETLPDKIRYSKIMMSVAIGIASFMKDDDLYKKRLSELAQYHGDDPSSAFLLIDHYFYLGDADKALENIKVMEKRIGKDGFTTYLKANLYYLMTDDKDRAIVLYKDAIKLEPSYESSYQSLATLYVEDNNYEAAVDVYKMLEVQFEVQFSADDFLESESNDIFKASLEFKNWMYSRKTTLETNLNKERAN